MLEMTVRLMAYYRTSKPLRDYASVDISRFIFINVTEGEVLALNIYRDKRG